MIKYICVSLLIINVLLCLNQKNNELIANKHRLRLLYFLFKIISQALIID